MAFDFKESIYSFFLITFIASIFAFYFGNISMTGYEPDQNTTVADAIGISQTNYIQMTKQIEDLNAMKFTDSNAQVTGTQKTTPDVFQNFIAGAQSAVCSVPLVSKVCAYLGSVGVITGLLQNTITWSWFFIDKVFDPSISPQLAILGWVFKAIFSLIQVVGITWILLQAISAIRGGK